MKLTIQFKDPDVYWGAIRDAACKSADTPNLSREEKEQIIESRHEKLEQLLSKWLLYGECITIEFDTESGTARVLEAR